MIVNIIIATILCGFNILNNQELDATLGFRYGVQVDGTLYVTTLIKPFNNKPPLSRPNALWHCGIVAVWQCGSVAV